MDHKKQPVVDWQHSHTMSSSVLLPTIHSHPLKQHSLPQSHNSLCPGYAMLKPVTPRRCPGPTGIHLNECRPLLLSLDSQTGTAASQMSECSHARTDPKCQWSSQVWRAEVRGGEPARLISGVWVSATVFSSLPGVLFTASHLEGCESAEIWDISRGRHATKGRARPAAFPQ